jgi:hypothetical protein
MHAENVVCLRKYDFLKITSSLYFRSTGAFYFNLGANPGFLTGLLTVMLIPRRLIPCYHVRLLPCLLPGASIRVTPVGSATLRFSSCCGLSLTVIVCDFGRAYTGLTEGPARNDRFDLSYSQAVGRHWGFGSGRPPGVFLAPG